MPDAPATDRDRFVTSKMTRHFISLAFLSLCAVVALATPVAAQDQQRIAATVNDEIISTYDVEQRVNLFIFSTGAEANPQAIARFRQQALRQLIDETLELQEASRWELTVSPEEIEGTVSDIAGRNNMTSSQLIELLRERNVNPQTLFAQMRADIAWNKLVGGLYAGQVSVSEEEIDFVLDRISRSINQPEYDVSEIFLPVDSPDQDEQVRQNAERLVAQIRRGASFPAVARQFSQSPSAAAGGDLGWVQDGQLPDELNDMLRRLTPGQFSLPVRSTGGYYVLALRDRRITGATDPNLIQMTLRQIVVPVTADMDENRIRQAGELAYRVSESVESCDQMREIALGSPLMVGGDIGTRYLTELADQFQQGLRGVPVGGATAPIPSQIGFHVVFVCDRQGDDVNLPSRESINDQLFQQQLSSIARRHLRDLRRDALIDIREGYDG